MKRFRALIRIFALFAPIALAGSEKALKGMAGATTIDVVEAKAVAWGFSKLHYFRGGMPDWRAAGYPVE